MLKILFSGKAIYSFVFISLFIFSNLTINLDFYSKYFPNPNTLSNVVQNYLLTDIYIGSNNQKISLNILFYTTGLFIIDTNRETIPNDYISENNIYYNSNTSSSFKVIYEKDYDRRIGTNFRFKREINSKRCLESIMLKDINNNTITVNDIEFFLASKFTKLPFGSGIIGLDLNNRYLSTWQYSGFLSELNKKDIIKNENFFISFDSYDNGKINIGLEDIPNKNNNYEEFKLINYRWQIGISGIEYGPEKFEKEAKIKFKISVNPLIGNKLYSNFIKDNFFNKYNLYDENNQICEKKNYDIYNIIICDKSIEKYFDKFPTLSFIFNNHKISFTAEDLFKKLDYLDDEENISKNINKENLNENDSKYAFMVMENIVNINEDKYTEWRVGKIFFSKVDLFFDIKRFKIGLLFKNSPFFQKNEFAFNNKIFIIILFLVLNLICIYSIYLYCIRNRKNKDNSAKDKKNKLLKNNSRNKQLVDIKEEKYKYKEMNDLD